MYSNIILYCQHSLTVVRCSLVSAAQVDLCIFFLQLDETLMERLWGLTEMFPERVRTIAAVLHAHHSSQSATKKKKKQKKHWSFTRSALWVGTTSVMILALPVLIERERLRFQQRLEQQRLQQRRQILFGPNFGMSGGMKRMMPPAPGEIRPDI
uniref:Mitochondrial import receptor subunit TOM22 homolog n=1 Tax=Salarias fasciatus TaxID=181472 RepID=A0A672HJY9_SALFA